LGKRWQSIHSHDMRSRFGKTGSSLMRDFLRVPTELE
jgi:hypothetical protein